MEHFDVLIVGAGISGIGAAYYLQRDCPEKSYAILEGRERAGGTWDLFRYPGVRSDSDMYTLGYAFKPWTQAESIADGESILAYLKETMKENDIGRHIRFQHWVVGASWSSESKRWVVRAERRDTGEEVQFSCGFLYMCSGYFDYDEGYTPDFPGVEDFQGEVVHPQKWTETVDYRDKRVVIIGSGATAVTLLPEIAKAASHSTMLQRSPTYMISRPNGDALASLMRKWMPPMVAYGITRWRYVLLQQLFFQASRAFPQVMKRLMVGAVRRELKKGYDVETHFSPSYKPRDQRVCLVPDSDLFEALNSGTASVVTDQIDHFTEKGIALKSGQHLDADLVVTATGLKVCFMSDIPFEVDGETVKVNDSMTYKAMMFSDIPNLALSFGYTNASWTLKCDLTSEYVCRLLNHMDRFGYEKCVPMLIDSDVEEVPFLEFTSGYVQRASHLFPRRGDRAPWTLRQNYAFDVATIRYGEIDDGVLRFS